MEQNILYQDNKSTILLANNGRWSSSKRTKHIKSRYFFIKDKIDQGEVSIEHQPTNMMLMWSDVLTKPKQGKGFSVDMAMLMNVPEMYNDEEERKRMHPKLLERFGEQHCYEFDAERIQRQPSAASQECVGQRAKTRHSPKNTLVHSSPNANCIKYTFINIRITDI